MGPRSTSQIPPSSPAVGVGEPESIERQTLHGLVWSATSTVGQQAMQFAFHRGTGASHCSQGLRTDRDDRSSHRFRCTLRRSRAQRRDSSTAGGRGAPPQLCARSQRHGRNRRHARGHGSGTRRCSVLWRAAACRLDTRQRSSVSHLEPIRGSDRGSAASDELQKAGPHRQRPLRHRQRRRYRHGSVRTRRLELRRARDLNLVTQGDSSMGDEWLDPATSSRSTIAP